MLNFILHYLTSCNIIGKANQNIYQSWQVGGYLWIQSSLLLWALLHSSLAWRTMIRSKLAETRHTLQMLHSKSPPWFMPFIRFHWVFFIAVKLHNHDTCFVCHTSNIFWTRAQLGIWVKTAKKSDAYYRLLFQLKCSCTRHWSPNCSWQAGNHPAR